MSRTTKDFEIVTTEDGSPSLRISDASGYVEKMHHSAGAYSESLYIYGTALDETLSRGWPLRVLSLGIGLGYNELLVASAAARHGISPSSASAALYSFETEPLLSESFRQWVLGKPSEFDALYRDIVTRLAIDRTPLKADEVLDWLQSALVSGRWEIRGSFPQDAAGVSEISCVLYDPFSNKMTPELWREDLIEGFLNTHCASNCVFSTYAATGALNRALQAAGFDRSRRRGFSGKRESTLAIRSGVA